MPAATNADGPAPNCSGHRCNNCGGHVIGRYTLTLVNGCNNFHRASSPVPEFAATDSRQLPCRQRVLVGCPVCEPRNWSSVNDWLWATTGGHATDPLAHDQANCALCQRNVERNTANDPRWTPDGQEQGNRYISASELAQEIQPVQAQAVTAREAAQQFRDYVQFYEPSNSPLRQVAPVPQTLRAVAAQIRNEVAWSLDDCGCVACRR